jgi:hypothetical protein
MEASALRGGAARGPRCGSGCIAGGGDSRGAAAARAPRAVRRPLRRAGVCLARGAPGGGDTPRAHGGGGGGRGRYGRGAGGGGGGDAPPATLQLPWGQKLIGAWHRSAACMLS